MTNDESKEPVVELQLTDLEAEKLNLQRQEVAQNSKIAAQVAYGFAETLARMVNAVNAGNEAQNEYLRLLKRIAKSRARQPEDIVDLDLNAKSIVFKKTKKEVGRDGEEKVDAESDAEPDGEDSNQADD